MEDFGSMIKSALGTHGSSGVEATTEAPASVEATDITYDVAHQEDTGTPEVEPVEELKAEEPKDTDAPPKDKPGVRRIKADGEWHEIPETEIDRKLSMAVHAEKKLAEANKAIQENQMYNKQWQSFISNPKNVVEWAVKQGVDLSQVIDGYRPETDKLNREVPKFTELHETIDTDYDTPEEIARKEAKNAAVDALVAKVTMLEDQNYRQQDKAAITALETEFMTKKDIFGVPENAGTAILALMQLAENVTGKEVPMERAFEEYVRSMPQPAEMIAAFNATPDLLSAIENNKSLDDALRKRYLDSYGDEVRTRQAQNKVPRSTSKAPQKPGDKKNYRTLDEFMGSLRPTLESALRRG